MNSNQKLSLSILPPYAWKRVFIWLQDPNQKGFSGYRISGKILALATAHSIYLSLAMESGTMVVIYKIMQLCISKCDKTRVIFLPLISNWRGYRCKQLPKQIKFSILLPSCASYFELPSNIILTMSGTHDLEK